jgi:hypothetical protein
MVAGWWVAAYTRTAPEPAAADRRAEVESDLFEQLRVGGDATDVGSAGSILGRTIRGVADDLAWRLDVERAPGRLDWHLAHPTTLLGVSLALDCTLETVWDTSVHRFPLITPLAELIHPTLLLLWAATLSFALVGAGRIRVRVKPYQVAFAQTVRRASICTMSVALAVAGLWRFAPDGWGEMSALAWATFSSVLLIFVATWLVSAIRPVRTILDFRKIPS